MTLAPDNQLELAKKSFRMALEVMSPSGAPDSTNPMWHIATGLIHAVEGLQQNDRAQGSQINEILRLLHQAK